MEERRETADNFFDLGCNFANFMASGGFGSQRSMLSSIFGIRDPFDDPFFTRPIGGSMLGFNSFSLSEPSSGSQRRIAPKPLLIEEIDSDDEKEGEKEVDEAKKEDPQKSPMSAPLPTIEHPDDNSDVIKIKHVQYKNDHNRVERAHPHTHSISFKKVTFGGVNGTYYSASTTRKAGTDGVVLEESREADRTTSQAAHRVSRGINDKGHSVTRKLGSDGEVNTMQTLHNLEKDELASFEESWKGNAQKQFLRWNEGLLIDRNPGSSNGRQETWAGEAFPSIVHFGGAGVRPVNDPNSNSSPGRPKKVVRINIE